MALFSKYPINPIFLLNVFLTSITLVLMGYLFKFYLPIFLQVSVSEAPKLWSSFLSWFTPSFLFFVVNFIILAIAASSRFQHRNNAEGVKVIQDDSQKESYDDVGRKNSFEYKAEFEGMVTEMYRHLDGKQVEVKKKKEEKPVQVVVKARKKRVEFTPVTYGRVKVADLTVKVEKKPAEFSDEPRRVLEVRTPKKWRDPRILDVNIKRETMETLAKKGEEDAYAPSKSPKLPKRVFNLAKKGEEDAYAPLKLPELPKRVYNLAKNGKEDAYAALKSPELAKRVNTIEIPTDYSEVSHKFDLLDVQAGKEENDTLDGTWKMIMESRRLHDAALQEEAMRSPSQSTTKKQERFNW